MAGGQVAGVGEGEEGGGGRDYHHKVITNDLPRGAGATLHERRGQSNNGSNVLKSLFRSNAMSVAENVMKLLVKRDKEISLILKEKEDQISYLENMMNVVKGELCKVEDCKNLLKIGLEDEKSSKLSFSQLCDNLTLEVDCLKRDLEKVTENANFVMNEVDKEKENEIILKDEEINNLTKRLKLKEESADSAVKEHRKEIEDLIKESNHFDTIGIAVKNRKEREIREARKEIMEAKSALDLKRVELEVLKKEKKEELELLRNEKDKEIEALRHENSCRARDFSRMSDEKLETNSALDLKEKELEELKVEKEKAIKVLQNEKIRNACDFSNMSKQQLKTSSDLEKEIEFLKTEREKNLNELRDEKEKEIEDLQNEKSRDAQEFSSMSNKVLAALKKEKKQNKHLQIANVKQKEQTDLVTEQKDLIQEHAAELETNNKKQKEEIDKLEEQKSELVVELETIKERQISDIEKLAAQEVLVDKSAAKRKEQRDKIMNLQTLTKYLQAKVDSLDRSNFCLRRKILHQKNCCKEEHKKDRSPFTKLVFKLKSKLRKQVHHAKNLETQLTSKRENSRISQKKRKLYEMEPFGDPIAEKNRLNALNEKKRRDLKKQQLVEMEQEILRLREEKMEHGKLGELASKNRSLQELNKDLFSAGSGEGPSNPATTEPTPQTTSATRTNQASWRRKYKIKNSISQKKQNLYEVEPPSDPIAEKNRLNALSGKKNQDNSKQQLEEAKQDISRMQKENVEQSKLGELASKIRSLQELNKDLFSAGSGEGPNNPAAKTDEPSPPTASGSKTTGLHWRVHCSKESSLEVVNLENAAEEHNLRVAYNVLDSTDARDGYTLVGVVLRGETDGDCKTLVGMGRGVNEAEMEAAKMALDFLERFDQGKDDFDEVQR